MKVERFIILVLLLLVVFFAYNKRPKHYHNQTKHVIERLERVTDTLKVDVIKYKQKVKVVRDTVVITKIQLQEAKEQKDTLKIIQIQDTLIGQLETEITFLDTLVTKCDSIISNQNVIIENKDTLIKQQQKEVKKSRRKAIFASIGVGILTIISLIK